MYVALEGLPGLGKSALLALVELYFPEQIVVLPELGEELSRVCNGSAPQPLPEGIWQLLPLRQARIEEAVGAGKIVLENSHLAVYAAFAAIDNDEAFLRRFQEVEEELLWPDLFLRLEVPLAVSLQRQTARPGSAPIVPPEVLAQSSAWLSAWHARRGDRVEVVDADRPPEEVLAAVTRLLGLRYVPLGTSEVFPYLLLLGRPAAGKSELIEFLKVLPHSERALGYHVGALRVLDDFPFLWEKFLEDDLWEELGVGRLHSRRVGENYAVANPCLWDFLILRLGQALEETPARPGETVVVEFSRGGANGYRQALSRVRPPILRTGAIFYLRVSYEESLRRNRARYDRAHRGDILTHSVPEAEIAHTYRVDDWAELALEEAGYVEIQGVRVPYVTVENEPEPRSPADFSRRFRPALEELFYLWKSR
ncbi:MAG: hypothetical protein ACUVQS_03785 [Candidatus Bipolaricaulaceae bacterium]